MVKFTEYFESMVALKPEWRKAFIDYPRLNKLLGEIKAAVKVELHMGDGSVQVVDVKTAKSVGLAAAERTGSNESMQRLISDTVDADDEDAKLESLYRKDKKVPEGGTDETTSLIRSPSARHLKMTDRKSSDLEPSIGQSPPAAGVDLPLNVAVDAENTPTNITHYMPHMSDIGVNAAAEFENLLEREVAKAEKFAKTSLETFVKYFDDHKAGWINPETSRPRAKDAMRYLYSEVSHLCEFIDTNELTVKKAVKKYLNSHPFFIRSEICEECLLPGLSRLSDETDALRDAVSGMWAEVFGTDVSSAKKKIIGRSASPRQAFRAGFFLALVISTMLYWAHVFFELRLSDATQDRFTNLYPVARFFIVMAWIYICWSGSLRFIETGRINYLYVMELSQRGSITWGQCLEYGMVMMWFALLFPVLYVRSLHQNVDCYKSSEGFPYLAPYLMPMEILLFVVTVAFPVRRVMWRTRNAFFRSFWRCCKLPFGGSPKFQDFFVADWGTSFTYSSADFLYILCYYIATPPEKDHLDSSAWGTCHEARARWGFPVAMIPYFWRACQTLKMYRKTGQTAHLVNHGKYLSMMTAFIFEWWFANSSGVTLHVFVWIAHIGSQLYAYVWDVLMDWGFIRGKNRGCIFKNFKVYQAAMVFDAFARGFFIPATIWIKPAIGAEKMLTIQAMLEIFRRAVWSIFRVENENLNNLETYRTVDFVPRVVLHEE